MEQTHITIRAGDLSDYETVASLQSDAMKRFGSGFEFCYPWQEVFALHVERGNVQLAMERGHPVGYSIAFPTGKDFYFHHLFVLSSQRGQGVGAHLWKNVFSRAREEGFSRITLVTGQGAPWNAPYYERWGFSVLKEDELELYLRKKLNASRAYYEQIRERFPLVWPRVAMARGLTRG